MKEIKFRAWHLSDKIMAKVSDFNYTGKVHVSYKKGPEKDGHFFGGNNVGDDWLKDEHILMQFTGLKGYEGDIVDVCIFLVSPSNPDNDQHFRGVIEFENGKFVFVIHKYLKFDGNKSEWINIRAKDLPFYEEELDEDGTYTVPYFDFLAMSSNLGEFCDDNVEIIGNIYENPELLPSNP